MGYLGPTMAERMTDTGGMLIADDGDGMIVLGENGSFYYEGEDGQGACDTLVDAANALYGTDYADDAGFLGTLDERTDDGGNVLLASDGDRSLLLREASAGGMTEFVTCTYYDPDGDIGSKWDWGHYYGTDIRGALDNLYGDGE